MKYVSIIVFTLVMFSCKNEKKDLVNQSLSAIEIVNKSIEVSGGDAFENAVISFNFRDKHYSARRHNGQFELSRLSIENKSDSIVDMLNNEGFSRIRNGDRIKLADSMATAYSASVNSVHYFSVLPYGLNNEAVNKELLGEEKIKNKDYYKIKVSFSEQGGGEDYEDIFVYWVDKKSFKVGYLAYSYKENNDVGMRFREAYNERFVEDLRFVDYNNYKVEGSAIALEHLGKAFENRQLELLSKIELNQIEVELINN